MPAPRVLGTATALVLAAILLTGCGGTPAPEPEDTGAAAAPTPAAPEPTTSATPEPTAAADPTCETLISESVVADYESVGWTAQESPLYIGSTQIEDGIQCMWANFNGPAGDQGQMFGWATLPDDEAVDVQEELLSQGWIREESAEGVYITESADTAIATDEEGYGMTYLFADGHVKASDTKQGILLIEWPKP
jgi:prepilin-type processing-associated H-X9-DG protein